MSRPRLTFSQLPFRATVAAACAIMVFVLSLFAASPAAHQWLHGEQHSSCEAHTQEAKHAPADAEPHQCAVVLFASGVSLPLGPLAITPPIDAVQGVSPVTAAEVFLVSPRYLRQPERGPPVNRAA